MICTTSATRSVNGACGGSAISQVSSLIVTRKRRYPRASSRIAIEEANPGAGKFQRAPKRHKLKGSMGRIGACGDNAAMESFFSLLQKNVLDRWSRSTRKELRLAIVSWIEGKYHRKRRQRRLSKLTPVEFETTMRNAVALAT